jgi:hypothetical protein
MDVCVLCCTLKTKGTREDNEDEERSGDSTKREQEKKFRGEKS